MSEISLVHHSWHSIPRMLTMLGPQANICGTVSPGQLGRQALHVLASQRTIPIITVKSSHWSMSIIQHRWFSSGKEMTARLEHTQKPARDMHRDTSRRETKTVGRIRRATDALMIWPWRLA